MDLLLLAEHVACKAVLLELSALLLLMSQFDAEF
jgi:hypothetical protein